MRHLAVSFLLLIVAFAVPALRAAEVPYDAQAFQAAVKSGRPVAVVFHADWCPTCRAQAPVLKQLTLERAYKDLTLFVADFDTEKALKQELRVSKQSTLVVFNHGAEISRSTGDTQRERLATVLVGVRSGA